jgi:predicted RNA polymerase sigma factor
VGPGGDTARASGAGQAGRVGRGLGAYGIQAAIAECHAVAPSVDKTDWERIVLLYEARNELERAVRLCGNERERGLLQRKLAGLG